MTLPISFPPGDGQTSPPRKNKKLIDTPHQLSLWGWPKVKKQKTNILAKLIQFAFLFLEISATANCESCKKESIDFGFRGAFHSKWHESKWKGNGRTWNESAWNELRKQEWTVKTLIEIKWTAMAKSKGYHPKGGKFHMLPLSSLLITFWGSCVPRCQFDSRLDQNGFSTKEIYIIYIY